MEIREYDERIEIWKQVLEDNATATATGGWLIHV